MPDALPAPNFHARSTPGRRTACGLYDTQSYSFKRSSSRLIDQGLLANPVIDRRYA